MYPTAMPSHGGKSLAPDVQAKVTELVREFIAEVGGQAAASYSADWPSIDRRSWSS